jgi:hypothetical protein
MVYPGYGSGAARAPEAWARSRVRSCAWTISIGSKARSIMDLPRHAPTPGSVMATCGCMRREVTSGWSAGGPTSTSLLREDPGGACYGQNARIGFSLTTDSGKTDSQETGAGLVLEGERDDISSRSALASCQADVSTTPHPPRNGAAPVRLPFRA